jgi:hypothetical protein
VLERGWEGGWSGVEWSGVQCKGRGRGIEGRKRKGREERRGESKGRTAQDRTGHDRAGRGGAQQRTSFRFPSSRAYSSSTSCSSGESVSDVSEPRLVERCSSFSDAIVVVFCAVVMIWPWGVLGAGFWVHSVWVFSADC